MTTDDLSTPLGQDRPAQARGSASRSRCRRRSRCLLGLCPAGVSSACAVFSRRSARRRADGDRGRHARARRPKPAGQARRKPAPIEPQPSYADAAAPAAPDAPPPARAADHHHHRRLERRAAGVVIRCGPTRPSRRCRHAGAAGRHNPQLLENSRYGMIPDRGRTACKPFAAYADGTDAARAVPRRCRASRSSSAGLASARQRPPTPS